MISLIVAMSTNNVIGHGGELPWHLSDDLKRFKVITMGKPVVMGRLTYESIGRPLPGRQCIVLSTRSAYTAVGCEVVSSPEAAIVCANAADEIMVIGGAQVYRQFLSLAKRIYLTRVEAEVDGDVYFPILDMQEWTETAHEKRSADESNDFDFVFTTLERT